jgi:hypothetical protein
MEITRMPMLLFFMKLEWSLGTVLFLGMILFWILAAFNVIPRERSGDIFLKILGVMTIIALVEWLFVTFLSR